MNSTQNAAALVQFKAGQNYFCRSACDYDCKWTFTVRSRSAKRLVIAEVSSDGVVSKSDIIVGIKVWSNVETCKPFGTFSMAPQLSADRLA